MTSMQTAANDPRSLGRTNESADALFELGLRCCLGREMPRDLISAHKWFNLAAVRGNHAAKQYRQEVSREMSSCDVAEAQKQARAWLQLHRPAGLTNIRA
jgi:TPR repeat protein